MEERTGEVFAGQEPRTVIGKQLHARETAPGFC